MPYSSEHIEKACPEGQHGHSGCGNCHPLDKPHNPGTKADAYHKRMGIPNTWYEQHGTTREEYEKEHGEEQGDGGKQKEEEKPKDKQEEQPVEDRVLSDPDLPTVLKWKAISKMREKYPEQYKKMEDFAQEYYADIRDNPNLTAKEKLEKIGRVVTDLWGDSGDDQLEFSEASLLDDAPTERVAIFLDSLVESARFDPISARSLRTIYFYKKSDSVYASYHPSYNGYKFNVRESLLNSYTDYTEDVKDPITGRDTTWRFHFDKSSGPNGMTHEYGHGRDHFCTNVFAKFSPIYNGSFLKFASYVESIDKDIGTILAFLIGTDKTPMEMTYSIKDKPRVQRMFASPEDYRQRLQKLIDTADTTKFKISMDDKGDYPDIIIRANPSYMRSAYEEYIKENNIYSISESYYRPHNSVPVREIVAKNRVVECEEAYKQLYNVRKIEPTDCYSQYGYYARAENMYTYTDDFKRQGRRANNTPSTAKEKIAEAYSDVILRGDRANSMSQLLVAHTYYELAIVMDGFDGSFMDYIDEYIGRGTFKERIIKSHMPVWMEYIAYSNGIAKGFKTDTPEYALRDYQRFKTLYKSIADPQYIPYIVWSDGEPVGFKRGIPTRLLKRYKKG